MKKEFRIGNLIQDNKGCICKVEGVTKEKIIAYAGVITSLPFSSIPLTEEWLLKFGFKERFLVTNLGDREVWVIFSFYIEKNLYYSYNGGNIEIKYVHQLQNLYFALTGKELIINNQCKQSK